jgi:hypothetical protein
MREGLARAVLAFWAEQPTARLMILEFGKWAAVATRNFRTHVVGHWPGVDSDRVRRDVAEQLAETDPYVLADEDCWLLGKGTLESGEKLFHRYPGYGQLSFRTTPDNPQPVPGLFLDGNIFESPSCGGVRVIRKGILTNFPPSGPHGYDEYHCAAMHRKGFRTGYFTDLRAHHLGYLWSTPLEQS